MTTIQSLILGCDLSRFNTIKARGFLPNDVEHLISNWPKTSSEYKLQVLADAIFEHYGSMPEYGPFLAKIMVSTQRSLKNTASNRLGKIIACWLHQLWPILPTINLTPSQAYNLFPEHALPPPVVPFNEKPFETFTINWNKCPQKMLHRPTGWTGALDSISKVLDHLECPKTTTVIGFADEKELQLLHQKWPETKILGFELPLYQKDHQKLEFLTGNQSSNIFVDYDENPDSYRFFGNPVDLILIRHPDSMSYNCWNKIVSKAAKSLADEGLLLITFHSRAEMLSLKMAFYEEGLPGFTWEDCVNPMAYNPLFTSVKGTYSFDFYLVAIKKSGNELQLFRSLQDHFSNARKIETPTIQNPIYIKKFTVIKLQRSLVVSNPGSESVHKREGDKPQKCLCCDKVALRYFRVYAQIAGTSSKEGFAVFCGGHLPNDAEEFERLLKRGGKNPEIRVSHYQMIGQSFPNPMSTSKL